MVQSKENPTKGWMERGGKYRKKNKISTLETENAVVGRNIDTKLSMHAIYLSVSLSRGNRNLLINVPVDINLTFKLLSFYSKGGTESSFQFCSYYQVLGFFRKAKFEEKKTKLWCRGILKEGN